MNKTSWVAVGVSIIVGLLLQAYIGNFSNVSGISKKLFILSAETFGFLIAVFIVPIVISVIKLIIDKSFPNDLFAKVTYTVLILLTAIMLIGSLALDSKAQNPVSKFRSDVKQQCIDLTSSVHDQFAGMDKNDLKRRAKNYCICLYDKVADKDLRRVLNKEVLLPEVLNLEYSTHQDKCFTKAYSGINTVQIEELFTTVSEKRSFWKGRLLGYYLVTYQEYDASLLTELNRCFEPTFLQNYSSMIPEWDRENQTATEILSENPEIKDSLSACYTSIN